eukprot:99614-Chlamydomonas_euryale.AAC.1
MESSLAGLRSGVACVGVGNAAGGEEGLETLHAGKRGWKRCMRGRGVGNAACGEEGLETLHAGKR